MSSVQEFSSPIESGPVLPVDEDRDNFLFSKLCLDFLGIDNTNSKWRRYWSSTKMKIYYQDKSLIELLIEYG